MVYLRFLGFVMLVSFLAVWGIQLNSDIGPDSKFEAEIYFCHFPLPELTKEMNASFSIIYSLRLDETGNVSDVTPLHDGFVGEDSVIACLEKWRFYGLESDSKLFISANWKHGIGWVELTISGGGIRQRIGRHGDLNPY